MSASYYIEAFDETHRQILGNLDGQAALRVRDYTRTAAFRQLRDPDSSRPRWGNVAYWRVVTASGRILIHIHNRSFVGGETRAIAARNAAVMKECYA